MTVVLLLGGSGKRLWPLSTEAQPKQFLRILSNGQGEKESMTQRVMRQLKTAHPNVKIYGSCNKTQAGILRRQLGDVEAILEPLSRNTFPAISLSAAYLHYYKRMGKDESFLACPVDVIAEDQYFQLFTQVKSLVDSGRYDIGLLGATPLYPFEHYGYISITDGVVTGFIEKPSAETAVRLISDGALWNCGVYALTIDYAMRCARQCVSFDNYESLYKRYQDLTETSFDYAVTEKGASVGVISYSGAWKDIGTWDTLAEVISG